jgi:F0F1-type ATP synthase membrane subunit c/vacuolar-type H+-ATPase subunit K
MGNIEINEEQKKVVRIIYFALLASMFIYGFVLIKVGKNGMEYSEKYQNYFFVFLGLSIIMSLGSIFFHKKAYIKGINHQQFFSMNVISWALNESICIYGFVLSFLSGQILYYIGFTIWAVSANLMMRPRFDSFEVNNF